jgi:hypothetical protein
LSQFSWSALHVFLVNFYNKWYELISSLSSPPPSYPLLPFQASGRISQFSKLFPVLQQPSCLLQCLPFFPCKLSCVLFPFCPWLSSSSCPLNSFFPILAETSCLPSILFRCPNHLNSLLSTILLSGSWFSIPLIWLFVIMSLHVLLILCNFLSHRVVLGDKTIL